MELLKQLCTIHAPSGNEVEMKAFILNYVQKNQDNWKVRPQIIMGAEFQDCLILVFGNPRTAVFAHMDSIGFTVRYDNKLVTIGGPEYETGYVLTGKDSKGDIETKIVVIDDETILCAYDREIERGTELVFKCNFRETEEYVQSCYLDNRLGVWNALKLAETLTDGIIVFSCWEEHGGGSVAYLSKFMYEKFAVRQALISDITWVTEGVRHGEGVVISMRDRSIPRRSFVNRIIDLAKKSGIAYQLEVEGAGGSDGKELQASAYSWDWIFIGAAESNVHSPDELVYKKDIESMLSLYQYLMENL